MTRSNLPTARARLMYRAKRTMNNTEAAYEGHLALLKKAGQIAEYWYEAFTFKLGPDCRYTPDFVVQLPDGELECHEVKGFWRDDALVKIKVASHMYPFRYIAIQAIAKRDGGGWKIREF